MSILDSNFFILEVVPIFGHFNMAGMFLDVGQGDHGNVLEMYCKGDISYTFTKP